MWSTRGRSWRTAGQTAWQVSAGPFIIVMSLLCHCYVIFAAVSTPAWCRHVMQAHLFVREKKEGGVPHAAGGARALASEDWPAMKWGTCF